MKYMADFHIANFLHGECLPSLLKSMATQNRVLAASFWSPLHFHMKKKINKGIASYLYCPPLTSGQPHLYSNEGVLHSCACHLESWGNKSTCLLFSLSIWQAWCPLAHLTLRIWPASQQPSNQIQTASVMEKCSLFLTKRCICNVL